MLSADVEQFYHLMDLIAARPGQGGSLSEYTGRSTWPRRGVYFFREPGEQRSGLPGVPRIVRVGTHAVSAGSKSTLWGRLRAHRGSRDGGGNHRGSIFRLHVGAALLDRDREVIGELPTWADGPTAPKLIRAGEATHERRVSGYIGAMSILWVEVPDDAGRESRRAYIERNAIALLSNGLEPLDPPSAGWLGHHSPRAAIRRSGLWNLNHVDEQYDPRFLDALAVFVTRAAA
ncbi:MAG: hypothetical protein WD942_08360 [Dehalococcoidia bacterium]